MNDTKHEYIGVCQFCGAEIKTFDGKRAACDDCRAKTHGGLIVLTNGWRWIEELKLYEEVVKLTPPPPPPPIEPDPDVTPTVILGSAGITTGWLILVLIALTAFAIVAVLITA